MLSTSINSGNKYFFHNIIVLPLLNLFFGFISIINSPQKKLPILQKCLKFLCTKFTLNKFRLIFIRIKIVG
jgi:hypothetical protein